MFLITYYTYLLTINIPLNTYYRCNEIHQYILRGARDTVIPEEGTYGRRVKVIFRGSLNANIKTINRR